MRAFAVRIVALVALLAASVAARAAEEAAHKFVGVDNKANKLIYVDQADAKNNWAVDTFKGVNSARRLNDGSTLLAGHGPGGIFITTIDPKGKKLGELVLKDLRDMRLIRRLKNGNILLTVAQPFRVIEVDAKGKIYRFRNIRVRTLKPAKE